MDKQMIDQQTIFYSFMNFLNKYIKYRLLIDHTFGNGSSTVDVYDQDF